MTEVGFHKIKKYRDKNFTDQTCNAIGAHFVELIRAVIAYRLSLSSTMS